MANAKRSRAKCVKCVGNVTRLGSCKYRGKSLWLGRFLRPAAINGAMDGPIGGNAVIRSWAGRHCVDYTGGGPLNLELNLDMASINSARNEEETQIKSLSMLSLKPHG